MRKIICRFRNQADIQTFNTLNDFVVNPKITQYDLDTDAYKIKTERKSTRNPDDSWKEFWKDLPNFYEPKVVSFAKIDFTTNNLSSEELSNIHNMHVWYTNLAESIIM